jgi:hypothetical protein
MPGVSMARKGGKVAGNETARALGPEESSGFEFFEKLTKGILDVKKTDALALDQKRGKGPKKKPKSE